MIFKVSREKFVKELKDLDSIVNGKRQKKLPYQLVALSTLGPDTIILWCGDVQRFCSAEVLDSGGLVFNIKQFTAILATFNAQDISIWVQDSEITIKAGDRKFLINVGSSTTNRDAFQNEQRLNIKKLKKLEEKAFFDLRDKLKLGQEISYVDNGNLQTGGIFLGFVNVAGHAMAQIVSHDRKVAIIPPDQIGRVFNRTPENPLSRRML